MPFHEILYYDFLSFHDNQKLFNTLNVRYLIGKDENNQDQLYQNPDAYGNAWAVDSLALIDNYDNLLNQMKDANLREVGFVLDKSLPIETSRNYNSSDLIKIEKIKNSSSHISYNIESLSEQLIVFSEIYYPSGWQAYLNGEKTNYFDINYLLRGMIIPKGNHLIEFHFSPNIVKTGINIRIITIIITFSIIALLLYRKNKWV